MPIQRTLDFFTTMGPGDVLLAGHLQRVAAAVGDELQVTPPQCGISVAPPAPGQYRYRVTLPGTGSLDIVGVCTAYQPANPDDDFRQIVHTYDRASRTIEFTIYEQPGPPGGPPQEVEIQNGERLYFWVHLYESAPQRPNLVIEAP